VPELLTNITSPGWAYLALLGLLLVDVFIPIIPTQVLMITGGALTVYGHLSLPLTIATGALGVFCGDLAGYLLGRAVWRRETARSALAPPPPAGWMRLLAGRFTRVRQTASRLTNGLRRPGPLMIMLCRFVPGGRMAACFHAGRVHYPYRRFLVYESAAALGWAAYGGLVGHLGGSALTGSAWRLGVVAAVAATAFAAAGWAFTVSAGRRRPMFTAADAEITPARAASADEPPR
jgi:membrane-associated protein